MSTYGGDYVAVDPPAGGTATKTVSDARGQTTTLTQYLGGAPTGSSQSTTYEYFPTGKLKTVTDTLNNTWSYKYDLRGRQIELTDPDAGLTKLTYDAASQLTSREDSRGTKLFYAYDQLGRKTELRQDAANGPVRASWTYDTLMRGKPTASSRLEGANQYTSQVLGYSVTTGLPTGTRVTIPGAEGALADSYDTLFSYHPDGSVATQTLPRNADANMGGLPDEVLRYGYDKLGRPTRLAGQGSYVNGSFYTPTGELAQQILGNTLGKFAWQSVDYADDTGRLERADLDLEDVNGEVSSVAYGYDHAGNVTSIKDTPVASGYTANAETQCFRYDGLRRLTEAWTPSSGDCVPNPSVGGLGGPAPYWLSWQFNAVGSRTQQVSHAAGGDTVATYTYPAQGQAGSKPHTLSQLSVTPPGQSAQLTTYGYDSSGNTTDRARPGGVP
ncbi:MAG: hypothetical protein L0Y54_21420, partial [Sporichthyaceae bacterium]|nr:hypothetical protein [Sporichthyaceae bacterium]